MELQCGRAAWTDDMETFPEEMSVATTKEASNVPQRNATNAIVNGVNLTSGATSGSFTFADNFVNAGTRATNPTYGSMATFLLGLPTSGSFNINPKTTRRGDRQRRRTAFRR